MMMSNSSKRWPNVSFTHVLFLCNGKYSTYIVSIIAQLWDPILIRNVDYILAQNFLGPTTG